MAELYTFYKIVSKDGKYIYVGSTVNFKKRMSNHIYNCCNMNSEKYNYNLYKAIRENGGWVEFIVKKIEEKMFKHKENALIREDELMLELKSNLNEKKAFRTLEEKKQYEKKYKNTKNNCDCGGSYSTRNKSQHFKTNKHKEHEQQTINNITYNITNLTINNK